MNKIMKFLIGILFGSIIAFMIYNWIKHSSYSGVIGSMTFPTIKTEKYTIETPGINPRVYEWNIKTGYHCIALFRDSTDTAPAMQCIKKKK